jgi:hypothetical protein
MATSTSTSGTLVGDQKQLHAIARSSTDRRSHRDASARIDRSSTVAVGARGVVRGTPRRCHRSCSRPRRKARRLHQLVSQWPDAVITATCRNNPRQLEPQAAPSTARAAPAPRRRPTNRAEEGRVRSLNADRGVARVRRLALRRDHACDADAGHHHEQVGARVAPVGCRGAIGARCAAAFRAQRGSKGSDEGAGPEKNSTIPAG